MTDREHLNAKIRNQLRQQRQQLSAKQQQLAARSLALQASSLKTLKTARDIASYMPFAGEIAPSPLTQELNANIALPRISNQQQAEMTFYSANNVLHENKWGIYEPISSPPELSETAFDVVLVPLVAFKRNGARLGMGGGFYDRLFAFRKTQPFKQPKLIGLAYDFQENDDFQTADWDVNLDVIITNREIITVQV